MHEFSFASHIADVVMQHVKKNKVKKVLSVSVEVGEFTMIIPEYLTYCFDIVKANYNEIEDAEMLIKTVPGSIKCNSCGAITEISLKGSKESQQPDKLTLMNPSVFTCSKCKDTDTKIISGKQALVKSMKVDD